MTTVVPAETGPTSLREFFGLVGRSLRRSLPRTIVFALIGAAVGYVVNVWWIARRYEGTNVPDGAPVTTDGNWFSGTVFWTVASIVVFGIIGYWSSVGNRRFWREVRGFPSTLADYFRTDGTRAGVHFLWGLALFALFSNLVSPAIGGMLAIGVLVMIPSILGRLVLITVSSSIRAVANQFQPDKDHSPPPLVSVSVGGVGAAVALALGFVIDDTGGQLILAAAAATAALTVSYYNNQSGTALVLLVLTAVAVVLAEVLGDASVAFADDGGWKECGEEWGKWLDCEGSSRVLRNAGLGSLASGLGAGAGSGLGGALATAPDVKDVTRPDGTRGIAFDRDRDGVIDGYAWDTDGDGVLDEVERFDRPPQTTTHTTDDGTVVTTTTDPSTGTTATTSVAPDGTTTTTYTDPDGATTTSTNTTQPDGTAVDTTTWPDGTTQTSTLGPDGTITTTTTAPDGTSTTTVDRPPVETTHTSDDGTVTTTSTDPDDGTTVTSSVAPDGTNTTTYTDPDGATTTSTNTTQPDGTAVDTTTWPDGTTQTSTLGPDGTITTTTTAPDGTSTTTVDRPPVETTHTSDDGTVTTTSTDPDDGTTVTSSVAPDGTTTTTYTDPDTGQVTTTETRPDGTTTTTYTGLDQGTGTLAGSGDTDTIPDSTTTTTTHADGTSTTTTTEPPADDGTSDTTTETVGTDGSIERSETTRTNPDGSQEVVRTTERIPAGPGQPGGTRITEEGLPDRTEYDDGTVEYDEPFDRTNETYNPDDGTSDTTTETVGTDGSVERSQTVRTNPDGSQEVVRTTERVGGHGPEPGGTRITEEGLPDRTEYDDGTVEYEQPFDRTNETYNPDDGTSDTTTETVGTDGSVERSQTTRTNPDGSQEVVRTTERVGGHGPEPAGTRITEEGLPDRTEYDDGTVEYEQPFDRTNQTYNPDDGTSDTTTETVGTDGSIERSQTTRTNPDGTQETIRTTERIPPGPGQPGGTRITEEGLPDRTEYDDGTVEYEQPFDRTNQTYNPDDGTSDTTTETIGTDNSIERSQTVRTNPDGTQETIRTTERIPPGPGQPGGTRITEQGLPDRTEYDDGTVEYEQPFDRTNQTYNPDDGTSDTTTETIGTDNSIERSQTVRTNPDGTQETIRTTERIPAGPGQPGGTRITEEGLPDRTEYDDGTVEYDEPFDRGGDTVPPGDAGARPPGGTTTTTTAAEAPDTGSTEPLAPADETGGEARTEPTTDRAGPPSGVGGAEEGDLTTTETIGRDGEVERSETVRTDREGNTEVIRTTERVGGLGGEPAGTRITEEGLPDRTEYDDGRIEWKEPFDRTNETYNEADGSSDTTTETVGTDNSIERSQTVRTDREGNTEVIRETQRVGGLGGEPAGTRITEEGLPDRTEYDDGRIEWKEPFDRTNETYNPDDGTSDTTTETVGTDNSIERSQTVRTDREGNTEVIRETQRVGGHGPEPAGTHIREQGLPDRTEYDDGRIEWKEPFDRTNETYNPDDGSSDTTTETVGTDNSIERSQTVRTDREGNTEVIRETQRVGGHGPEPAGTHIREQGLPDRTEYDDGRIEWKEPFDRTNETYNPDDGTSDTTTETVGTDNSIERSQTVRTDREGNTEVIRETQRVGGHGPEPAGTHIREQGLPDRTEYDDGRIEWKEPFDRTNETYNPDDGTSDTTTETVGTDNSIERSQTVRTDREGNTEVIRETQRVGGHGPEPAGTHIREEGLPDRTEYDDGRVEYDEPFDRTNETPRPERF